jgi:hypothetical protein
MAVVEEQLADYRTVIKYARQQAEFDPNRIILWGTSFSGTVALFSSSFSINKPSTGGHAITLAAEVRSTFKLWLLLYVKVVM